MPDQPPRLTLKSKYRRAPQLSTTERGYGSEHQKARKRYLGEHPICERCQDAFSTDLHHRDGDPFHRDPSNFEALCEACHHGEAHAGGK